MTGLCGKGLLDLAHQCKQIYITMTRRQQTSHSILHAMFKANWRLQREGYIKILVRHTLCCRFFATWSNIHYHNCIHVRQSMQGLVLGWHKGLLGQWVHFSTSQISSTVLLFFPLQFLYDKVISTIHHGGKNLFAINLNWYLVFSFCVE